MANLGRFLSSPKVQFNPDGLTVTLLEDLKYLDPQGLCWMSPRNAKGDGASIPRPFWSFIGSPLRGNYVPASIIHDFYCSTRTRTWRAVHRVFYHAMLSSEVPLAQAKVMYAAVYCFGPRWTEMDSNNVAALVAKGIEYSTAKVLKYSTVIEDCSDGPGPASIRTGTISFMTGKVNLIQEGAAVLTYSLRAAQGDFDWIMKQFNNDEEVDLNVIDIQIEEHLGNVANPAGKTDSGYRTNS